MARRMWYTAVHGSFHSQVAFGLRRCRRRARPVKTRQAIIKAIRKGTLSATKDESGEWRIDPAELFRVYPPVPQVDDTHPATENASDTAGLRREIEVLRERLAEKDELIDDLREDRDRWREQATRLLPAPQPAARRGWWWRLLVAIVIVLGGAALASDEDRALANTVSDYSSCAAFYVVGAACIARSKYGQEFTMEQMQEDAAVWKSYENALQQSMQLMPADVGGAVQAL